MRMRIEVMKNINKEQEQEHALFIGRKDDNTLIQVTTRQDSQCHANQEGCKYMKIQGHGKGGAITDKIMDIHDIVFSQFIAFKNSTLLYFQDQE